MKFRNHTGAEAQFVQLDRGVLAREDLTWQAKLVYQSLRLFADADGICWPSLNTLKKKCGLGSHNTVDKGIAELIRLKIIRREYSKGRVTRYHTGWTVPQNTVSPRDKGGGPTVSPRDKDRVTTCLGTVSPRDNELDSVELDTRTREKKKANASVENGGGDGMARLDGKGLRASIERMRVQASGGVK